MSKEEFILNYAANLFKQNRIGLTATECFDIAVRKAEAIRTLAAIKTVYGLADEANTPTPSARVQP